MVLHVKRIYAPPHPDDGARVLVDRLWPRGLRRDDADLDLWLRDAAPSDDLRRWFDHDPDRWDAFLERYAAELDDAPHTWKPLAPLLVRGPVTLLYAARDEHHNNARALAHYLARTLDL
ncbi:MAG: DUF488 family protein [Rubricoccaceae bacterium]|nr:DUF488 family protein [Rubricoccaceae bacterium]